MKSNRTHIIVLRQFIFSFVLAATALDLSAQLYPEWTDEDRARLAKGQIISGLQLLVDDPPPSTVVPPKSDQELPPLPEEEPAPVYDPELIPEEFLSRYFSETPKTYLIDPQQLLSRQEAIDREGFLAYHAKDSKVDIMLYLFDAQQIIPEQFSLDRFAREQYEKSDLTAVVFCFLGDPSRNQFTFAGKGSEDIETLEKRRILEGSLLKAMEKSEPDDQVEAFIIELSIKLYWMEQAMADARIRPVDQDLAGNELSNSDDGGNNSRLSGQMARVKPYLVYICVAGGGIALALFGMIGIFIVWRKSRRYHFPILEMPRRLGAEYAAGVGAIMAFHNKYGSPSSQRDQVPDYLTRI